MGGERIASSKLTIVNVVATADLKQFVDPAKAGRLQYCLYDLDIYRCIYVKSDFYMHSKVSVFTTGKMISVGTKSEKHARQDLQFVARYLAEAGLVKPRKLAIKLQNIVASVELENPLMLVEIASKVPHMIYEPEQFPAAIYHPRDPIGVSILIFASGKAVIAGGKDMFQLRLAAMELDRISGVYESKVLKS
jgi:TATA-box binding protein (TBP) (component of TFIID and TFIIIB)